MKEVTFKNIPFQVPVTTDAGGRRLTRYEIPSAAGKKNAGVIYFDNGAATNKITLDGFIPPPRAYQTATALKAVLQQPTPGQLRLPGGEIITVRAETWSITDEIKRSGILSLTIEFLREVELPPTADTPQSKLTRALDAIDKATVAVDNAFQAVYEVESKPLAVINDTANRINNNVEDLLKWQDFLENSAPDILGDLVASGGQALQNNINNLTVPNLSLNVGDISSLLAGGINRGFGQVPALIADAKRNFDAVDRQFNASLLLNGAKHAMALENIAGTADDWRNLRQIFTKTGDDLANEFAEAKQFASSNSLRLAMNETGAAIVDNFESMSGFEVIKILKTEPISALSNRFYGRYADAKMQIIRGANRLKHQAMVQKGEIVKIPKQIRDMI